MPAMDLGTVADAWETTLALSLLENLATVRERPLPSSLE